MRRPGATIAATLAVVLLLPRPDGWTVYPDPGWDGRDGAGLLPLNGSLYLLGGWEYGPQTSEVWRTSDLVTWERLPDAPWGPRHGAAWLVHDERLWVIGGDLHTDVWSSPDGIDWTQETADAPFGPRYTPNAVSLNGSIIVYGGQSWADDCWCTPVANSDVWRWDGTWEKIAEAPWLGRGLVHGSVVHDGEAWLIGGGLKGAFSGRAETVAEFRDVWSSPDGIEWRQRGSLQIPARTHFSVLEHDGCWLSDGSVGLQANLSAELFHAPDCLDYQPIDTPYGIRHASSLAWFDGLVVLGGPDARAGTDVWRLRDR